MVKEIRIYVEGGGSGKISRTLLREGLSTFLGQVLQQVRARCIRWSIIACGPRQDAFESFTTALDAYPDAFSVLLVDAEGPVGTSPSAHLRARDNWQAPGVDETQYHLMVQAMEAWFLADAAALGRFYGDGFRANAIPKTPNVEIIDNSEIIRVLAAATRDTQKGAYHKTKHGFKILGELDPAKVRAAAPHCERLFAVLLDQIDAAR